MGFPSSLPPHRVAQTKGQGVKDDATELDRKYDAVLAAVTGPGGRVVIDQDGEGRAIVGQFPAQHCRCSSRHSARFTDRRSGHRRRRAADVRAARRDFRPAGARTGRHAASARATASAIAMRNCPAWVLSYMAAVKAGAVATLLNGWWQPNELEHALQLTEPKLVLADEPRAKRIAATCATCKLAVIRSISRRNEALADAATDAPGRCRTARNCARGRRHHPFHLGLDR